MDPRRWRADRPSASTLAARLLRGSALAMVLALSTACAAKVEEQPTATPTAAPSAPAPEIEVPLAERLDGLIREYADRDLFAGAVLIGRGDEVIFKRAYGKADLERDVDNDPDMIFRIGSVAKQLVAALVLRMVEAGALDLQAPITAYLPDYPNPAAAQITLEMLLSHTSGIPNYTELPMYREAMNEAVDPATFMQGFAALDLDFQPGSDFRYTNSGFYILGVILEKVSGRPLAELLQAELVEPLGLTNTGYDNGEVAGPRRAKGYTWDGQAHRPEKRVHASKIFAAGMVYSTAEDLLRWTRAMHAGSPFGKPETGALMTQLPAGKDSNYQFGLGLVTLDVAGTEVVGVGHGGGLEGFEASLLYVPENEWTIVVLCNTGEEIKPLADALLWTLAGATPEPPVLPVSREFARLIALRGLTEAQAWLQEAAASGEVRFSIGETALYALGHRYRSAQEYPNAVAVFEIAVEVFPDSAEAHRGLAEASQGAGDRSTALQEYERAWDIDPESVDIEQLRAALSDP